MQLAVKQLVVPKENPRKTKASEASHDALVASIRAHGLIQPIVVRPKADNDNLFEVIAGSRRLAAVKELGLETVEVVVNDGPAAIDELGTHENMMRAAMHPLDEAEVIARLLADGDNAENIASRFGQTDRWVHQRVKLTGLSKSVKDLFRLGGINLAAAQAFTLADKKEQDAYLKRAREPWQLEANSIERQFTNAKVPASKAIFDLALYPEKDILRDLFSEDVWLTDREKFLELQAAAVEKKAEELRSEGWSDVLVMMDGYDHTILNKYVRAEGTIKKADRSKYVAVVVFTPGSGDVSVDRGFVLRKVAGKVKVGQETGDDAANPEEVKPLTLYDLSTSQQEMIGALQTRGLQTAIENGDTYLALLTILAPLLDDYGSKKSPAWAGLRPVVPNYVGVNVAFDTKIEGPAGYKAKAAFPDRKAFEKMPWEKVMELVRLAALVSIETLRGSDKRLREELEGLSVDWFRYDAGFLRRYRLDQLQHLAKKLGVPFEDVKKKDLVTAILAADKKVIPLK